MLRNADHLLDLLKTEKYHNKIIENANSHLTKNRSKLEGYSDIYDLVIKSDEGDKDAKAFEFHMTKIRNALIHVLWGNEIFIGTTVIENLVFYSFKNREIADPVVYLSKIILDIHELGKGVAVFPIHSVRLPTTLFAESAEVVSLNLDEFGIRVYPQANSFDLATSNIRTTINAFGIKNELPNDLLEHWFRSRPLDWVANNPILIVRLHNIPGNYYENQKALIESMHFATSLIYGIAALSFHHKEDEVFNTRITNNRETLDYRHYLTLYPTSSDGRLEGDCIPIQRSNPALLELSDLDIFLSAENVEKINTNYLNGFANGISENRKYFFSHSQFGTKELKSSAQARLARKLTSSLRSFRRSHLSSNYNSEHIFHLATAFEVLLTDNYSKGVGETLRIRTEEAMKAAKIDEGIARAHEIADLYDARCEIAHSGAFNVDFKHDLNRLRETFVIAYSQISNGFSMISAATSSPIKDILKSSLHDETPSLFSRLRYFGVGLWFDISRRFFQLVKLHR